MNRGTRILLGVFLGLLVVVLAVAWWPRNHGGAELRIPGWGSLQKTDKPEEEAPIDRIDIETAEGRVTLTRDGTTRKWTMSAPEGARADRYKVRQMLEVLKEDLVSVIPSVATKEDEKAYGLDDQNRIRVTWHRAGQPEVTLEIGSAQKEEKEGPPGAGDTFVRVAGDSRVWRVLERDLRRPFEGGLKALRDRRLLDFESGDVQAIEIRDPEAPDPEDREIRLVSEVQGSAEKAAEEGSESGKAPPKKDRTWRFEVPSGLAAGNVSAYVASLAGIYVQEYVDALPEGWRIDDQSFRITAVLEGGRQVEIRLSNLKDDQAFVQVSGVGGYGKVARYAHDQLRKHTGELRDTRLFGIPRDRVQAVEIRDGTSRVAIERAGNTWRSVVPAGLPLGRAAVEALLTDLETLKADAFLPPSARQGVQMGLEDPIVTVTVTTTDGGRRVLKVGAEKGSGSRYVALEPGGQVALLPGWSLARVRKGPEDLRQKTFFDFDQARVRRIEIAQADETLVLVDAGETAPGKRSWKAVKPREVTSLKDEAVGLVLGTVAGWTAKAIARDPAARKAVSGKPEVTVTAELDDGTRHTLRIYAEKKDGDPYGIAPDEPGFRDVVLVLNQWQVSQVRKRLADLQR
ncbi:MAG TPA: DUF4340 domain-containing protein [Myxococcota bacterium]|nr:DUF4340 domain-containing protein [Myxococcota bacterium]HQK52406.1 DUF4340 domain-containing protein [Myxococcota bacterium]